MSVAAAAQNLFDAWAYWTALGLVRPFAFALFFAAFFWMNLGGGMLRMAFALAVLLPALSPDTPQHAPDELALPYFAAVVKEFLIGGSLGFTASAPFAVAAAAGGIVDLYRGAGEADPDPAGGQLSSFGVLLSVATLWLFANAHGFEIVSGLIYASYRLWPVQSPFPLFSGGADAFLTVLEAVGLGSLVLAGPVLTVMFLSDLVHLASAKFGKNINVSYLAFSNKNVVFALVAPFTVLVAVHAVRGHLALLGTSLDVLREAFR
jgi:type III secretion protein T